MSDGICLHAHKLKTVKGIHLTFGQILQF